MQNSDFEGPPLSWSVISIVGAIATAVLLIIGLEMSAKRFRSIPTDALKPAQVSPQARTQPED